jgi:hypothetical protein
MTPVCVSSATEAESTIPMLALRKLGLNLGNVTYTLLLEWGACGPCRPAAFFRERHYEDYGL